MEKCTVVDLETGKVEDLLDDCYQSRRCQNETSSSRENFKSTWCSSIGLRVLVFAGLQTGLFAILIYQIFEIQNEQNGDNKNLIIVLSIVQSLLMILGTFLFFMVEGFLDNCCLNKIQYENFGALGNFSICNWLCSNSFFVLGFLVLLIALLSGIVDGKNEQTKWILIAISVILLSFISFFSAIKHIDGYCLSKLNRYDTFNSTRNLKSERCHESGSCLFVFGVPLTVPLALLIYTILEVDDELTRPFTIRSSIVLIVLVIMCIVVEYMEACINACCWILYKRTGQQKPVNISRMCKNFLLAGTFFIFCLAIVLLEKQYLIFGRFRIDWFLIILLIEISIYLVIFIKSISTECVPWITRKRKSTKTNVFIYTL